VLVTRHGPIVFKSGGSSYALRWTALDPEAVQLEAFHQLIRARNWQEFRAALKGYSEPSQSFVYADVNGHIGYYAAGKIPIRRNGDGSLPYDGTTDAGEWTGAIPFDKLPHLFDPPSGIIVSANNRIVGSDYPYVITRAWVQPYRARRIYDLLQAKGKLTADDFRAIQGDTHSLAGTIFAREVVKTALESARAGNDSKWLEALQRFQSWDGYVNANSRGTLLITGMRNAFRRRILAAALGEGLRQRYAWANSDTLIDRIITERPREWLPGEFKDYAELFRACYLDARDALMKRLGANESKWEWEYAPDTSVRFQHPLAGAPLVGQKFKIDPFPQNGSATSLSTVNAGPTVSMRFIADVSNWDKTLMGIPLGQSGDPSSPFWKDQLEDWRAVSPREFPFSKDAVAQASKQILVLAPASEGGGKVISR
jgi:penicillin amidase